MTVGAFFHRRPPVPASAVLLLVLAAAFIGLLHQDWEVYPQYGYGWLVPLIAAYLFHRRWLDRPVPVPIHPPAAIWSGAIFFFALLWPLVWIFREANPDWRLVSWASGGLAVGCMLAVLGLQGGKAWLAHFSFPVLLLLVAIPWPSGLEQALIQAMTRAVTATTVEGLIWCGVFAEQSGNVIHLARGSVGVDEACSGVRSFQSNLMAALVVGELFRLGGFRRVFLLAAGLGLGFVLNLFRGMFLAWNASRSGAEGIRFWHDPAGYTILLVSFGLLLLLAYRLKPRTPDPGHAPHAATPPAPAGWLLLAGAAWIGLSPLLTEAWYRAHEGPSTQAIHWRLSWPADNPPREQPVPEQIRTILRFGEARSFQWTLPDRRQWFVYEMDWPAGRAGAQLARSHSPDICLPASGSTLENTGETRELNLHGLRLYLTPYTFSFRGRPLHVFFLLWEQQNSAETARPEENYYAHSQRIRSVLEGRRNRGQKVIHATLLGYPDREQAEKALLDFLEAHIETSAP